MHTVRVMQGVCFIGGVSGGRGTGAGTGRRGQQQPKVEKMEEWERDTSDGLDTTINSIHST